MVRCPFLSRAVTSCACSVMGQRRHPCRRQLYSLTDTANSTSGRRTSVQEPWLCATVRPSLRVFMMAEAVQPQQSRLHTTGDMEADAGGPVPANGRNRGLKQKERRQAGSGEETGLRAPAWRCFGPLVFGMVDRSCGSVPGRLRGRSACRAPAARLVRC
jgi:hypothetical protein